MQAVRNSNGKLVCRIDTTKRIVEIVVKGCTTTISFSDNGDVSIHNAYKVA